MNPITINFRSNIITWLFWYSLFSLITARFVPIYFVNNHIKLGYYSVLLICLAISSAVRFSKWSDRIQVYAKTFVLITSFLLGMLFFLLLTFITLTSTMFGYMDAAIFYTQKSNPEIKIVSRYYDEGAMGGGGDAEDYEIVLKRPFTPFFRLETGIDTNNIDKTKWIKISSKSSISTR